MSSVLPTGSSTTSTPTTTSGSTTGSSAATGAGLITSTGIGSGLDITAIVSSLTTAYGAAQSSQLDAQQQTLDTQVSAYGTFTSALDQLQVAVQALESSSSLNDFSANVADKTIASATTSASAVAGQYSLQVTNLATAATLTSGAFTGGTSATVGTGTLSISAGGKISNINIDSSDNSLAAIASAINNASDNPGVTASIITTTAGSRLVISGTSTGAANAISVSQSGGDGGLAALTYSATGTGNGLTQTTPPQDASFSINGYPATSASNVVSGAITGVTINLTGASAPDTPTTLTVTPDTTNATTLIGNFVSALNGVVSSIQTLTSYDPTSGQAGPLNGDATLETFQSQLQNVLNQVKSGSTGAGIKSLSDLGITAQADGTYTSDPTALGNVLSGNLSGVISLFTGTNGLASQIDKLVNGYTGTGGLLDNINQGLTSSLKSVASQQAQLQTQLATYSATLTTEYNAMDTAVAKLKEMQQYLNAEFNQNSSSSSSGSSNSSLGSGNLST
ncbi:MAG TPA: flagellar filament capping protein FliD [Steroidobacteraceae bacterium]|jgi:flagellar hook-associated protein 2